MATPIISPLTGTITTGNWVAVNLSVPGVTLASGRPFHFEYLLPANYSTNFLYPVMIWLHPNFSGNDHWYLNTSAAPLSGADADGFFNNVSFRTNYPSICVVPYADQTNGNGTLGSATDKGNDAVENWGGWTNNGLVGSGTVYSGDTGPNVFALINNGGLVSYILSNFTANPNKVYVQGFSLGGIGTEYLMLKYNQVNGSPKLFTAGTSTGGVLEIGGPTSAQATIMQNVPVWWVSGGNDGESRPADWNQPMWTLLAGNSSYPAPGGTATQARAGTSQYRFWLDPNIGHQQTNSGGAPYPTNTTILNFLYAQSGNVSPTPPPTPTPSPTPPPSPTPTPPTQSANNTVVIYPSGSVITDSNGNQWGITTQQYVTVNGGVIDTPLTILTPTSGGSVTDGTGLVYTLDVTGNIAQNGNLIAGSGGTSNVTVDGGIMWGQDGTSKTWYTYSPITAQFTAQPAPPSGANNTKELVYVSWNGGNTYNVWEETTANLWYRATSSSGNWLPTSGTLTSPLPGVLPQSITINSIPSVNAGATFPVSGSLINFPVTPTLELSDDSKPFTLLPSGNIVSNTTFSFTHGVMGQGNHTLLIANLANVNVNTSINYTVAAANTVNIASIQSANDTVIAYPSTGRIIDANGNFWSIGNNQEVYINNNPDTSTANVIEIAYVITGNTANVWYENSVGLWFYKSSINSTQWLPITGTPTSPLPNTLTQIISLDFITANSGNSFNVSGVFKGLPNPPILEYSDNGNTFVIISGNTANILRANITNTSFSFVHPPMFTGVKTILVANANNVNVNSSTIQYIVNAPISNGTGRLWYNSGGATGSFLVTPIGANARWSSISDAMTIDLRHSGTVNAANSGTSIAIGQASDPIITFKSTSPTGSQRDAQLSAQIHVPVGTTYSKYIPYPTPVPPTPTPPSTSLFADDFTSLSIWNGSIGNWQYCPPFSLNGYIASDMTSWFTNPTFSGTSAVDANPYSITSSILSMAIKARPADVSSINVGGAAYLSGYLQTSPSFSITYGYFECRAKMSNAPGTMSAFWLYPLNPGGGNAEIDICETLGNQPTTLTNTLHSNTLSDQIQTLTTVADMTTGFHTYGCNWQSDFITWYFDGAQTARVPTPSDLNAPMYILLDTAAGTANSWEGQPTGAGIPSSMQVDYVNVWTNYPPPSSPPTPSPTPPTPPPTPPPTLTIITPTSGGSVTDSLGHQYTMNAANNGSIYDNTIFIPGSGGTAEITVSSGTLWAEDGTSFSWYTYSPTTGKFTAQAGTPFPSPTPSPTPTESQPGTTIPPSANINASPIAGSPGSGNILTISGGTILNNGSLVPGGSSGVTTLYYIGDTAFQFNGTNWFGPIISTSSGSGVIDPRPTIALSNLTIVHGAASGTVVGAISTRVGAGNYAWTYTLSGTNASSFNISGTNLVTNGALLDGNYSININASNAAILGSPFIHAFNIVIGVPQAPLQASNAGFTNLAFNDDFTTSSTIAPTVNSTAAGYNWYWNSTGGQPTANTTFVPGTSDGRSTSANGASKGIMVVNMLNNNFGAQSQSVPQANLASYVNAWQHGYFEAYIQFDVNGDVTPHGAFGWPAFWSYDTRALKNPAIGSIITECDFMEQFPQGNYGSTLHNWQVTSAGTSGTNMWSTDGHPISQNSDAALQPKDSGWHKYGMLWTGNGTIGTVKFFYDDQVMVGQNGLSSIQVGPSTNSSSSGMTSMESAHIYLILGSGVGWTMNVDWVRVWQ